MADKSQLSAKDFFSKVIHNEFRSLICSSSSTPAFFIPLVIKEEQKEYQRGKKRQNMRDSRDFRKVKDIAKGKKDTERKVIMNHPDTLNMLNQIKKEDQNFSHAMSSSTNILRPLAQKRKQIWDTNVEKQVNVKAEYEKTSFTHILGLTLIKLHENPTSFLEKQSHTSKIAIETLIPTMILASLPYITGLILIGPNQNGNGWNV